MSLPALLFYFMPQSKPTDISRLAASDLAGLQPFALLQEWLVAAAKTEASDPDAAALGTISDADGLPSVRMVLVRRVDADKQRLMFYTNYDSNKARDMDMTGQAALCFHWKSQSRQIRMAGSVARLTAAESDAYYASRPYGSRIGAWASKQSRPLPSRDDLAKRVAHYNEKYPSDPPRPHCWGGYALSPQTIEFWQEGEARLHHRLFFGRDAKAKTGWQTQWLYP